MCLLPSFSLLRSLGHYLRQMVLSLNSISTANLSTKGDSENIAKAPGTSRTNSHDVQSQFLQLLMAQLTHQNPENPMDSAQFTQELAILQQVDDLNKIEKGINTNAVVGAMGQAAALIGKQITANVGGQSVRGIVSLVEISNGTIQLRVNDQLISPDEVQSVASSNS